MTIDLPLGPITVAVLMAVASAAGGLLIWVLTRRAHHDADTLQGQTLDLLKVQNSELRIQREEATSELAKERDANRAQAERHQTEITELRTRVAVLQEQVTSKAAVAELTLFVAQQTAALASEHAALLAAINAMHQDILLGGKKRRRAAA